jgi:GLPGLI family protein
MDLFMIVFKIVMKQWLFVLFLFSFPSVVFSQVMMGGPMTGGPMRQQVKYNKVDNGVIRVYYETKIIKDISNLENKDTDFMALDIGEKGISRYYSDNRRRMDSLVMEFMKRGGPVQINRNTFSDMGISSSGDPKEIFKNYPSGKITVTDRIAMSDYLYEEDRDLFQWQIESDTREILSYTCQKATVDFRGRHYEAWFTPDLPVNDGPWKFAGLPGLILAVEDSNANFSFQAVGIENSDNPVEFAQKDYLKTSRTEVEKLQKKFNEDPMGYVTNSMPGANIQIRTVDRDGVERSGREVKFPYNPMELE